MGSCRQRRADQRRDAVWCAPLRSARKQLGQSIAKRVRLGVMHFGEDVQGVLPGGVSCSVVAYGEAGIAKTGEAGGFLVVVAEFVEQVDGAPVAVGGLRLAGEVVGVAEAVPGVGLAVAVADVLVQGECAPTEGERLLLVAELGLVPTDRVGCGGLPAAVAGRLAEPQRLPGVLEGAGGKVLPLPEHGENLVGVC